MVWFVSNKDTKQKQVVEDHNELGWGILLAFTSPHVVAAWKTKIYTLI